MLSIGVWYAVATLASRAVAFQTQSPLIRTRHIWHAESSSRNAQPAEHGSDTGSQTDDTNVKQASEGHSGSLCVQEGDHLALKRRVRILEIDRVVKADLDEVQKQTLADKAELAEMQKQISQILQDILDLQKTPLQDALLQQGAVASAVKVLPVVDVNISPTGAVGRRFSSVNVEKANSNLLQKEFPPSWSSLPETTPEEMPSEVVAPSETAITQSTVSDAAQSFVPQALDDFSSEHHEAGTSQGLWPTPSIGSGSDGSSGSDGVDSAIASLNQSMGVDCVWDDWMDWSPCTKTCGVGSRMRLRGYSSPSDFRGETQRENYHCNAPLPDEDGTSTTDRGKCSPLPCPEGCWLDWAEWGACDVPCGRGTRTRTREQVPEGDRRLAILKILQWNAEKDAAKEHASSAKANKAYKRRHHYIKPLKTIPVLTTAAPDSNVSAALSPNWFTEPAGMLEQSNSVVLRTAPDDRPLEEQAVEFARECKATLCDSGMNPKTGPRCDFSHSAECIGKDSSGKQLKTCPPCQWKQWQEWSACYPTLFGGRRQRSRVMMEMSEDLQAYAGSCEGLNHEQDPSDHCDRYYADLKANKVHEGRQDADSKQVMHLEKIAYETATAENNQGQLSRDVLQKILSLPFTEKIVVIVRLFCILFGVIVPIIILVRFCRHRRRQAGSLPHGAGGGNEDPWDGEGGGGEGGEHFDGPASGEGGDVNVSGETGTSSWQGLGDPADQKKVSGHGALVEIFSGSSYLFLVSRNYALKFFSVLVAALQFYVLGIFNNASSPESASWNLGFGYSKCTSALDVPQCVAYPGASNDAVIIALFIIFGMCGPNIASSMRIICFHNYFDRRGLFLLLIAFLALFINLAGAVTSLSYCHATQVTDVGFICNCAITLFVLGFDEMMFSLASKTFPDQVAGVVEEIQADMNKLEKKKDGPDEDPDKNPEETGGEATEY